MKLLDLFLFSQVNLGFVNLILKNYLIILIVFVVMHDNSEDHLDYRRHLHDDLEVILGCDTFNFSLC